MVPNQIEHRILPSDLKCKYNLNPSQFHTHLQWYKERYEDIYRDAPDSLANI